LSKTNPYAVTSHDQSETYLRHNLRQFRWWSTTVVVEHFNFEVINMAELVSDDVDEIHRPCLIKSGPLLSL